MLSDSSLMTLKFLFLLKCFRNLFIFSLQIGYLYFHFCNIEHTLMKPVRQNGLFILQSPLYLNNLSVEGFPSQMRLKSFILQLLLAYKVLNSLQLALKSQFVFLIALQKLQIFTTSIRLQFTLPPIHTSWRKSTRLS